MDSVSPITLKQAEQPIRPRSFVFSPINEENVDSYSATPRRKLCLDSLEDSPKSTGSSPTGFSEQLLSMNARTSPTTSVDASLLENLSGEDSKSHLYSRRQRHSLILPGKENVPSGVGIPRSHTLSSLPASPLTATDIRFSSLLKQINSPLERMKINSPIVSCTSSEHSNESDGYFSEVFDQESTSDENSNSSIPDSINTILTKPFATLKNATNNTDNSSSSSSTATTNTSTAAIVKKATPVNARTRHTSLRGCLKRPTPTVKDMLPGERKAKRVPLAESGNSLMSPPTRRPMRGTTLFRSQSLSVPPCENAMYPISPSEGGVERIGDHSKPFVLPLMKEPTVPDLKNISPETLARLLKNDYVDLVDEYTIVDCRYPYEYEGGHITGSINIWEKDEMLRHFFESPLHPDPEDKRKIIIFHCEFSSKRGPEMNRFMRKIDRERNGMDFPKLYHPEIYLLHGGYKNFYCSYPQLCEPNSYKCMLDENHKEDLKHFSKRSKSWSGSENLTTRRKQTLRHRRSAHEVKILNSPTDDKV